ncbi:iron complex outermembrane receptor protein [Aquimarina sp. MAR_2010_214]|uniref:TonB-dependent siderophore receptor n=1 Tax=Aquimarina sp. MAR_2010_214 TaxID=1250026 RepID=UPI000C701219|nr:TonB-dependent siderophore receptor [Aquimarina sp. MAR_2010_214]PKV52593.1 iron complex outermembrane receptor protein [Aquimarina sp. MAR_2010_214]
MNKFSLILLLIIVNSVNVWGQVPKQKEDLEKEKKINVLPDVIITENKRKVKNDTTSSTLKIGVPLIEIPQNIISVSAALLKEQGAFVLKDAARNASGVYFGLNNDVFDGAGNLYLRGFTQNGIFRNGLPSGNFRGSQDDEAVIDRIEFIKGPAGFLGSKGEAGGKINIVTKTPGNSRIINATLTGGSYNFYRAAVDLGSIVKEKGFSYRFNAAYNYQQYFVDIMKMHKFIIAPVIQYNFSKRTSILAEYVLNNQNAIAGSTFTKFFPTDKLLTDDRRANYLADPGLPNSTSKAQNARLVLNHEFNDNWKMTHQSSYSKTPADTWSFLSEETYNAVGFDENGRTNRLAWNSFTNSETLSTQFFVNGKFKIGKKIKHHVLVGTEYARSKDSTYQSFGLKSFLFDINNLQYGLDRNELLDQEAFLIYKSDNNFLAAYLYNNIKIGKRLIVDFGGQYTYNENKTIFNTEAATTFDQKAFTPRVGITYMIDKNTSVFALYDESFVPKNGQDKQGNLFKPIRGQDKEIGIKRNWFNGLLSTSVTAFNISRNNMTTQDPTDPLFSVQLGQVVNKGIEVDVIGNITKNISISANYAYTKGTITKDTNPAIVGQLSSFSPRELINSWVRYTFPANVFPGFSLSLGNTSIVKRATNTVDAFLPDYSKFDGSIAYTRGKFTTRLLLDNLTNKRYILTGDIYEGNAYYTEGAPFNFKISLSVKL